LSSLGFYLRISTPSPSSLPTTPSYTTSTSPYGLFNPAPRQLYPWLFLVPGDVFYYPLTIFLAAFAEGNLIEVRSYSLMGSCTEGRNL
jgi:hypothetical protein